MRQRKQNLNKNWIIGVADYLQNLIWLSPKILSSEEIQRLIKTTIVGINEQIIYELQSRGVIDIYTTMKILKDVRSLI